MLLTVLQADRGSMDSHADGYKALLAAPVACEAEQSLQPAACLILAHFVQPSALDLQLYGSRFGTIVEERMQRRIHIVQALQGCLATRSR